MTASIDATPTNGTAPLVVVFQAGAFGGSGQYTAYSWDFGDGAVAEGDVVAHRFTNAGTYRVSMEVRDSSNASAQAQIVLDVRPAAASAGGWDVGRTEVLAEGIAIGGGATTLVAWGLFRGGRIGSSRTSAPISSPATPRTITLTRGIDAESANPQAPAPAGPARSGNPLEPSRGTPLDKFGSRSPGYERGRNLALRLLIALSQVRSDRDSGFASEGRTQAGLAAQLGVHQSAVSKVVRRLEAAGVVRSQVGHAHGARRQVRVYRLTERGERAARSAQFALAASTEGLTPRKEEAVRPGASKFPEAE